MDNNKGLEFSDEEATAPPIDQMDIPVGYERASFKSVPLKPPEVGFITHPDVDRARAMLAPVTSITEQEVYDALADFVSKHCCYGDQFSKHFKIKDIVMQNAVRYVLETFAEMREVAWAFEPFEGNLVQHPTYGPPPGAWDVHVPSGEPFKDGKKVTEIPNSSSIKPCHSCVALGKVRCKFCFGHGGSQCMMCNGRGRRNNGNCISCQGRGRRRCHYCSGHGQVKCSTCKGFGQIRCFLRLTVTWTNHTDDYFNDETPIDKNLIRNVNGVNAIEERYPRLNALFNFPDQRIVRASDGLIKKHAIAFPTEKILEQRHKVSVIPVAIVYYKHKERENSFFVYGLEQEVLFDDYPDKCCWGACVIL